MLRCTLAAVTCIVVSGCYPALKVVRPRVDLVVQDSEGKGLQGAAFTLATYHYPFPMASSTTLTTHQTGVAGDLKLNKRRKWLWQIALPDGIRWYDWAYCVEKPGYRAVVAVEPDFTEPIAVMLERSTTSSVCDWPTVDEPYYQVEVVEK